MNRSTLYYNIPDGTNRGRGMHHAISPPTHRTETSRTPHGIPRHSAWLLLLLLLLLLLRARPSAVRCGCRPHKSKRNSSVLSDHS